MKLSDYIESLKKSKTPGAETMLDFAEVWSNGSCAGYTAAACMAAGLTEDQTEAVLASLESEFDRMSVDEAEQLCLTSGWKGRGQLTDANRQKAAAYSRKLLNKQQAIVIVGADKEEYNTVRDALDDLRILLAPGEDLTITDRTGAVRHLFRWFPEQAAEGLTTADLRQAIYPADTAGFWLEIEPTE